MIYFPSGSVTGGKDGLLLEFKPNDGERWLGCFAFGHSSYSFRAIFASPNPHYAGVVSRGAPYWVNARDPAACSELKFFPVLDTRVLAEERLLLMSDFSSVALVGHDAVSWRSPQLCWDELQILKIDNGIVTGVGYDPTDSVVHLGQFRI